MPLRPCMREQPPALGAPLLGHAGRSLEQWGCCGDIRELHQQSRGQQIHEFIVRGSCSWKPDGIILTRQIAASFVSIKCNYPSDTKPIYYHFFQALCGDRRSRTQGRRRGPVLPGHPLPHTMGPGHPRVPLDGTDGTVAMLQSSPKRGVKGNCRGKRSYVCAGQRRPTRQRGAPRPSRNPLAPETLWPQKPSGPSLAFPAELPVSALPGCSGHQPPRAPTPAPRHAARGGCRLLPTPGRGWLSPGAPGCRATRGPVPGGTSSACLAATGAAQAPTAPVSLSYPALNSGLGAQLQLLHKMQLATGAREA